MNLRKTVVSGNGILLLLLMLSAVNFLGYGNYIMTFTLLATVALAFEYIYQILCEKTFLLLFLANIFYVVFLSFGINRIDRTVVVTALLMPLSAYLTGAAYIRLSDNKTVAVIRGICYVAMSSVVFGYFTSLRKGDIKTTYTDLYQINQLRTSFSIWDGTILGATTLAMFLLPAIMCVFYAAFCLKGTRRIIMIVGGVLGITASFGIASRLNILLAIISVIISFLLSMKRDGGLTKNRVLSVVGGTTLIAVAAFLTNIFGFRDTILSSVLMQRLSYYEGSALTATGRLETYSYTLNQIIRNPLGGIVEESGTSSHNLFLQFAVSGGWIACFFIVLFFIMIYKNIILNIKNHPEDRLKYLVIPIVTGFLGIIMVESPVMSNPLMYSVFISYLAMFNEYYTYFKVTPQKDHIGAEI